MAEKFTTHKKVVYRAMSSRGEYKGHQIKHDAEDGDYWARIGGTMLREQSLKKLLLRIDGVIKRMSQVKDLHLLYIKNPERPVTVRVTQILPNGSVKAVGPKPTGYREQADRFDFSRWEAEKYLAQPTEENMKILARIVKIREKIGSLDEQVRGLEDQLVMLDTDDYTQEPEEEKEATG